MSPVGAGRPTLTRVQVGLVSLARELKHDLDSIAARADTSNSRGLHHLLQGKRGLMYALGHMVEERLYRFLLCNLLQQVGNFRWRVY